MSLDVANTERCIPSIEIASNSEDYFSEDETETFGTRSEVAASFEDELEPEDSVSCAQRSEPSISEEFPGGSEYADSEIQWDVRTQSHSVDEFGCTWIQRFKDSHLQWTFFTRQAKRLARLYGVPPEELVFGKILSRPLWQAFS